jgi:hypothetical protein
MIVVNIASCSASFLASFNLRHASKSVIFEVQSTIWSFGLCVSLPFFTACSSNALAESLYEYIRTKNKYWELNDIMKKQPELLNNSWPENKGLFVWKLSSAWWFHKKFIISM